MTYRHFTCLCMLLLALLGRAADDLGYLQVRGPIGVRILLDGRPAGTVPAGEDGLIIRELRAGDHQAQAWQREHLAREATLIIKPGRVTLWDLGDLEPAVVITPLPGPPPAERLHTGSLMLHTVPVACDLDIPDLGVDGLRKEQEMLLFEAVPVGQYQIIVRAMGKTLSTRITVAEGQRGEWLFDFSNDDILDATPMRNKLGQGYRYLRPGEYTMGDRTGRHWEQPRQVRLSQGFWIGEREVTVGEFRALMADELPQTVRLFAESPANNPITVTWEEAVLFASRLSAQKGSGGQYRLPTEAEWEYACRAGTTGDYSGELADLGWYANNSVTGWRRIGLDENPVRQLQPVASKAANPWGLYDLHGSLAEWCLDRVATQTDKEGNFTMAALGIGDEALLNPLGTSGDFRVLRGGDYLASAQRCRSWSRSAAAPDLRAGGFRLVFIPAYAIP
jgi:formylglycine-generating enzyme required for sulfatase activity